MPAVALPPTAPVLLLAPYQSAKWILSRMPDGGRVVGLMKGQASLTDLAVAAAERLGKGARLTMFAWGVSPEDLAILQHAHTEGVFASVDFRMDTQRASGERFHAAAQTFGRERVAASAIHAEVALVERDGRAITIRGSMGNYHRDEIQQFDFEEGPDAAGVVRRHHEHPQIKTRFPRKRDEEILATQALDPLTQPDGRTFGMSLAFGLAALVRAALDITGSADIEISTWSIKDTKHLSAVSTHPNARRTRMVIDRGFIAQNAHMYDEITAVIGRDNLRQAQAHSKIVVIRGEQKSITLRGSMNLSANPRAENFDACTDRATADFFGTWFQFVFDNTPIGLPTRKEMGDVLKNSLGGGISETAYTSSSSTFDMAALMAPPKPYDAATMAALMAPPKQLTLL